jgi:twitching motility two-component system response regulator PilH
LVGAGKGQETKKMAKILIAEDSATAAAVLKKALAPMGHTILVASDGEEAERQITAERPDLVILDIIMPKVNGFQLCRSIRQNPALADLKVIMVTSMDRESDRYWGMKQGADEYLTKPVDIDLLKSKVRRHLLRT